MPKLNCKEELLEHIFDTALEEVDTLLFDDSDENIDNVFDAVFDDVFEEVCIVMENRYVTPRSHVKLPKQSSIIYVSHHT